MQTIRYIGLNKVLTMGWGWMLLLIFVFPLIGIVLQLIFAGIMVSNDEELTIFVFMLYPFIALGYVFACWQYVISVRLNKICLKPNPLKSFWYRLFFWCGFPFMVISTIILTYPLILANIDPAPDSWLFAALSLTSFVYIFLVFVSFLYCTYFTARTLNALFEDKEQESRFLEKVPYFLLVLVFPVGIPFFNKKIAKHYGPKSRYIVEID